MVARYFGFLIASQWGAVFCMGGGVRLRIGTVATTLYMTAARRFAIQANELDDLKQYNAESASLRSNREASLIETSLTAVMISHSAIESVLNELYLETDHFDQGSRFPNLRSQISQNLKQAWAADPRIKRMGPVRKAALALKIAGCQLDWGQGAPQAFVLHNELRNALVHHEPFSSGPDEPIDKLERALHSRFELARIWQGRNVAFRWAGALGGGCASWAYDTAEEFQVVYFGALGCGYPRPPPDNAAIAVAVAT